MATGIYTIENLVNGKLYVGLAKCTKSRKSNHYKELRRNVHKNNHLQNAWNEYGEQSFRFEVLEECDEQFLYSQENYWCNMLDVHNRDYGYNIEPTNPNGRTKVFTTEQIENLKIRNAQIVICEVCGKEVNYLNYHQWHGENCGMKREYSQEYKDNISQRWKGVERTKQHCENISKGKKGKKMSAITYDAYRESRKTQPRLNKSVTVYNLSGKVVQEFQSRNEAAVFLRVNASTISAAISGTLKTVKGYKVTNGKKDNEICI